eukprot:COSAG06_NODE_3492_length_5270_cov_2.545736_4_plen_254_part_00
MCVCVCCVFRSLSHRAERATDAEHSLRKTYFFLSFSYVCPEPVLVKRSFLYINGSKVRFSHQIEPRGAERHRQHSVRHRHEKRRAAEPERARARLPAVRQIRQRPREEPTQACEKRPCFSTFRIGVPSRVGKKIVFSTKWLQKGVFRTVANRKQGDCRRLRCTHSVMPRGTHITSDKKVPENKMRTLGLGLWPRSLAAILVAVLCVKTGRGLRENRSRFAYRLPVADRLAHLVDVDADHLTATPGDQQTRPLR